MARAKVIQQVFADDLDGSAVTNPDTELSRVVIGLEGVFYQIDLKRSNRTKFKKAVDEFIKAAEKAQTDFDSPSNDPIGYANVLGTAEEPAYDTQKGVYKLGLRAGGSTAKATATSERAKWLVRVREWANANGHEVSDRGRVADKITAAYVKNNADDPEPA